MPPSVLRSALLAALLATAAACGGGPSGPAQPPAGAEADHAAEAASLTVFSGRDESLMRPLLERFLDATGTEVEVRYGDTADLAAALLEGETPAPADVFLSVGAAPLGALAAAGLLRPLPRDVLDRVPGNLADPDGLWVGLSGRARTVVYDSERVQPQDLPQDLDAVGAQRFHGRWGLAPRERSFEAHLAVYRALNGGEALDELLARMTADEPRRYASGQAVVAAVAAGEVDWGLVDHFELWRSLAATPDAPVANFYMPAGDASGFVNLAGAGVLSDNPAAVELVRYLLSDAAQRRVGRETFEYPLVAGIVPVVDLLPLADLDAPDIDFREVAANLDATREAIVRSGLAE